MYKTTLNINNFLISYEPHYKSCKLILKLLGCNGLWIIKQDQDLLTLSVTDQAILQHYLDKKYYLEDPHINLNSKPEKTPWHVSFGTDYEIFYKNGFSYDLFKLFDIEEFASIETSLGSEYYCFRFFTRNNRFVLMNKILNKMPIIKYFTKEMIKQLKLNLTTPLKINANNKRD